MRPRQRFLNRSHSAEIAGNNRSLQLAYSHLKRELETKFLNAFAANAEGAKADEGGHRSTPSFRSTQIRKPTRPTAGRCSTANSGTETLPRSSMPLFPAPNRLGKRQIQEVRQRPPPDLLI